jgi:SOS response regulatory protein OraA/RecX
VENDPNGGARGAGGGGRGMDGIAGVRRRWGKLYVVTTAGGARFLVLKDPSTVRFLETGAELDGEALEALRGPVARAAGLALAYRLLAVRDRTEHEIRAALGTEGIGTPEVVADIVDTLRRQGYLDDRRLASHFVQYRVRHRPGGPRLLKRKLREAGVSDEIAEEEIREALPPEREREIAEELARRKMRGATSREQAVRRVHGFLMRRGFGDRTVNAICSAILRGTFPGENDDG